MAVSAFPKVQAIAAKFTGLRRFQREERGLIGRDTDLVVVEAAIVARQHVILYGNPGLAKSMTVDGVLKHVSISQFKTQAYKASPPEQFLGPISIEGMTRDEFVRIVKDRAADVEVFFCDEVARAPRALLPAFQGMMVEREFDAGNGVIKVPLMTFVGTCNHLPEDPELEAFFDRFALKLVVQPPPSQQQFVEILQGALKRRRYGEPPVPEELKISREELLEFQAFTDQIVIPDEVTETLGELWANLLGIGVQPSIRRYVDATQVIQAIAALDGRDEVILDDMQIVKDSLWTNPDERAAVAAEVVKFASAWVREKVALVDGFSEQLDRLGQIQSLIAGGADTTDKVTMRDAKGREREGSITEHSIKVLDEQKKLRPLIEKHIGEANGRGVSDLEAVLTQMDAGKAWISDRIMAGLSF